MKRIYLIAFLFTMVLFSCQNENKKTENKQQKQPKINSKLVWTFDSDASSIKWTGFKTTEKIGVHGEFKQFDFKGINRDVDLINTILQAQVKVNVFSIFSGEESRDKILIESLFQKMTNTDFIEARLMKIDRENHKADVVFNMNSHEKMVSMDMKVDEENGTIKLTGKIDLLKDFGADDALSIFHEKCKDKHTGKDGVSKTWSEVEIEANLKFKR